MRGQGGIVSEGSQASYDFTLNFLLTGDDYDALVAQMKGLLTTIAKNTKYVLRIDLTSSTTHDMKVMRLESIRYPLTSKKKVVNFQEGVITFKTDVWS